MNEWYRKATMDDPPDRVVQMLAPLLVPVTVDDLIAAAAKVGQPCQTCHASGIVFEDHGMHGQEALGCPDCHGLGIVAALGGTDE